MFNAHKRTRIKCSMLLFIHIVFYISSSRKSFRAALAADFCALQ